MSDLVNVTAVFERDDEGTWLVHLTEEPRAHTYGRTFLKALRNIREVASMWNDVPEDQVALRLTVTGTDVSEMAAMVANTRAAAELAHQAAVHANREAVRQLMDLHLAERDIAEIVGLSHQRVHQLADARGVPLKEWAAKPRPARDPLEDCDVPMEATSAPPRRLSPLTTPRPRAAVPRGR